MISSLANPRVKYVRRLQSDKRFRKREQAFVVEGTRMLREANDLGDGLQVIYFTESWTGDAGHQAFLEQIAARQEYVTTEVMSAMSDMETPPGILAVVDMHHDALPERPTFVLVLDGLTTPGNLGTILRSAGAANADAVLLAPGCVDAYNPKVIRGAMGAHFRIPIQQMDWPEIALYCSGSTIWLTDIQDAQIYTEIDWRHPSTLIIGSEARGPSKEARNLADGSVIIPMAHDTESLNAATAASIILFEAFRQRGFAV